MVKIVESIKNWLSPKKSPEDLIIQLETFSELLDMNRREIEAKAEESKQRALKYLKSGQKEQARIHMKYYLQYNAQAMSIDNYKATLDSIVLQLSQGQLLSKTQSLLSDIQATLKGITLSLPSLPNVTKEAEKINKMLRQLSRTQEAVVSAIQPKTVSVDITDDVVDQELNKLAAQEGITEPVTEKEVFPEPLREKIEKAKERLKRLEEV